MALSARFPDLDALALLVAVSAEGSIGAAARAVGVSQQTASERLAGLEKQVGVPLLQRRARGSTTTAAGTIVVEWAARLLQLAEEVDASLGTLRAERDRVLRVHSSMTIAEHLLPRWLAAFRRQHADDPTSTAVSLTAGNSLDVITAVREGRAEVGFIEGATKPTGLGSRVVASDELVLVSAPGDPLARRRRPLTPAQVAELALTAREPGSGTREVVVLALAAHGLASAPPAVEVTTSTALRESVRAGGAPAFLSRRAVDHELAVGDLVLVATTGLDLTRSLRAIWSGGRQPPPGPVRDLLQIASRASQS